MQTIENDYADPLGFEERLRTLSISDDEPDEKDKRDQISANISDYGDYLYDLEPINDKERKLKSAFVKLLESSTHLDENKRLAVLKKFVQKNKNLITTCLVGLIVFHLARMGLNAVLRSESDEITVETILRAALSSIFVLTESISVMVVLGTYFGLFFNVHKLLSKTLPDAKKQRCTYQQTIVQSEQTLRIESKKSRNQLIKTVYRIEESESPKKKKKAKNTSPSSVDFQQPLSVFKDNRQ